LSGAALSQIGGARSKTGIFVLTGSELRELAPSGGKFTRAEVEHVRPVINTRDVFPYAAVLPPDPDQLIWLPGSHGGENDEFPANMPTLQTHLKLFKPLLEATVEGYRANRPWWSAHRPRLELVEGHLAEGSWADLAVTTRWGDRKLVTGLAPAHSLPLSGLHAVTGEDKTSAAYLVGLINSTPVQELAEALAPGSISQDDIEQLGLPQFGTATTEAIEERSRRLADTVHALIAEHGQPWPSLPDALREDITLSNSIFEAWAPAGAKHGWGTLGSVAWTTVENVGRISGSAERTELSDDLLGRHLIVHFSHGRIHIDVDDHPAYDLRELLQALVVGAGSTTASKVLALPVPVSAQKLVDIWEQDHEGVTALIKRYRDLRSGVDAIVLNALGTA